eukprot:scaffold118901_cov43-Tisochrysis_lutea.AAC.2
MDTESHAVDLDAAAETKGRKGTQMSTWIHSHVFSCAQGRLLTHLCLLHMPHEAQFPCMCGGLVPPSANEVSAAGVPSIASAHVTEVMAEQGSK